MNMNPRPPVSNQLILGIVAIGFGVLFLLRNLGVIEADGVRQFWPLVLVFLGVLKIMLHGGSGSARDYFWGGALILVGSTMTLHRLGVIDFSWHAWWPVLLIAFGVSIMLKGGYRQRGLAWKTVLEGESDEVIDAAAILGSYRRQVRSQNFRGGDITAIMGGCEIDLRDASINGEAVLNVVAFWGGIELKVPTDWTVILQGSGIMGGFVEKTKMPADSNKRLVVRGYAIMGGFEAKN